MAAPRLVETLGGVGASSTGTLLTAGAANAKGAWVSLGTLEIDAVEVSLRAVTNSVQADYLIDLALGPNPDQQALVDSIIFSATASGADPARFRQRCAVRKGTEVWARLQSTTGAATLRVVATFVEGEIGDVAVRILTAGAETADSGGTAIDSGTTPNTIGAKVEMHASLPRAVGAVSVGLGLGGDFARSSLIWHVHLYVGAANDEARVAEFDFSCDALRDATAPGHVGWVPVCLPAGSRVSLAASCTIGTVDRLFDAVLYLAEVPDPDPVSWTVVDLALTSGGVNAKGAWTEVIAATARDGDLAVQVSACSGAARDSVVDIAIGESGAEQLVAADLPYFSRNINQDVASYYPMLVVPKSARIVARAQSSVATTGMILSILLAHRAARLPLLHRIASLGVVTSGATRGTSIDSGDTAHADGALVELSAALPFDVTMLALAIGNQNNSVRTTGTWLAKLLTGAANDEAPLIDDILLEANSTPDTVVTYETWALSRPIPKGTRLTMRARSTITNATDRLFDAAVVVGGP